MALLGGTTAPVSYVKSGSSLQLSQTICTYTCARTCARTHTHTRMHTHVHTQFLLVVEFNESQSDKEKKYLYPTLIWKVSSH